MAEAPPLAVELLAQAEILEAELTLLEAIDGEPIWDALVELIEELVGARALSTLRPVLDVGSDLLTSRRMRE